MWLFTFCDELKHCILQKVQLVNGELNNISFVEYIYRVSYYKEIKQDRYLILQSLVLEDNAKIWEMQVDDVKGIDGIVHVVSDNKPKQDVLNLNGIFIQIYQHDNDEDFRGLVKLYQQAERENTSVLRQIIEFNEILDNHH